MTSTARRLNIFSAPSRLILHFTAPDRRPYHFSAYIKNNSSLKPSKNPNRPDPELEKFRHRAEFPGNPAGEQRTSAARKTSAPRPETRPHNGVNLSFATKQISLAMAAAFTRTRI